jgi:hypothetical protein
VVRRIAVVTALVHVAAASDRARGFDELGKAFEAKTHITPVFTFGSSAEGASCDATSLRRYGVTPPAEATTEATRAP